MEKCYLEMLLLNFMQIQMLKTIFKFLVPWAEIEQIGANVRGHKISRHFEIFTKESKFLFASKDSGKILKIAREKLGNDKVVKLPTLLQTIGQKIKNLFAKK